jgi:uncharacterized protein YcfJ
MRFIRKNGRVIPIREKSDKSRKQGVETTFRFSRKDRPAKARFKEGALAGGILGTFVGSALGVKGALGGAAIGSVVYGAAETAFGRRSTLHMDIKRIRKVEKRRT